MKFSDLRGAGRRSPASANTVKPSTPSNAYLAGSGVASSRRGASVGLPELARLPDRKDPSRILNASRRPSMPPRNAVPISSAAPVNLGTQQLKASDMQRGDVLFYQRPASKPPPKPLAFYKGIVKGQELVANRHSEYSAGGSAKTVHVSVCVEASESGAPQIAEASETRGVGQRDLPPGHYVVYRSKDEKIANETARLMGQWTSGENAPRYSKTKAANAVLNTVIRGADPGYMSHKSMTEIALSADSRNPNFQQNSTFCSDIVAAAIMGGNRRGIGSHSDEDAIEIAPNLTVPSGLQAQLGQNPNYEPVGSLDMLQDPKPAQRSKLRRVVDKLSSNLLGAKTKEPPVQSRMEEDNPIYGDQVEHDDSRINQYPSTSLNRPAPHDYIERDPYVETQPYIERDDHARAATVNIAIKSPKKRR
jgi:hypothetical protein